MKELKVQDSDERIEVKKFFCLGSNYYLHIEEMQSKKPAEPVIFTKPATAMIADGDTIVIPPASKKVHHEVELAIIIGREGKNIAKENAFDYIFGYAVGMDITLRDIQSTAKKEGRPWAIAKGFDTAAPMSAVIPKEKVENPEDLPLKLSVNSEVRQQGNTKDMIFKIGEIIAYISQFFTLEKGDVIMTGTPAGVGEIKPGDKVKAEIKGLLSVECAVE